jgi:lipid-A-disaccharide synthase
MKMVSMVDVVLVASGTATLVVGLLQKPMVIMYKMSPLTVWLARRIVKGTRFFGLINLVLGKKVVPELLQEEASVENLTNEMMKYVNDVHYRKQVEHELAQAPHVLGDSGVTARVASQVQDYLQ